jgi:predicted metallopeptidase
VDDGFDFTRHVRVLCEDMAARLDLLGHVDMSRVAVGFSQARSSSREGMYASLTPLRFAGGQIHALRRGRKWGMQKVCDADGREMLYILTFYLPRFLNLPFRDKLETVLHELWHVGPKFDGDVRRLGRRCFAHGPSKKKYDRHVSALADEWLALSPPKGIYDFLRFSFRELAERHGRIFGGKFPAPKLFRVD